MTPQLSEHCIAGYNTSKIKKTRYVYGINLHTKRKNLIPNEQYKNKPESKKTNRQQWKNNINKNQRTNHLTVIIFTENVGWFWNSRKKKIRIKN